MIGSRGDGRAAELSLLKEIAVTAKDEYKHVFGPVPSRRLGRSLGVDLVPFKTCTYDCVYCQLGRTTNRTAERREYVPLDAILPEIDGKLAEGAAPDYITLSGSGEPTLYLRLGELIDAIKARTSVPVAVITNGSLLWDRAVQDALLKADLVVPSLDVWDQASFDRVNRPCAGVDFDQMSAGVVEFSHRFTGELWLEVLIVDQAGERDEQVTQLAALAKQVRSDRIHLNTVVRPPTESSAKPVSREQLERWAPLFGDKAEVIAEFNTQAGSRRANATTEEVLDMIKRRPCSLEDVAAGLAVHPAEALKHLGALCEAGTLTTERRGGVVFYVASEGEDAWRETRTKRDKGKVRT
jgi:wyosine [tRNA(Phe)-imidazoG37] synthetase (radical SAM superfamily)